MKPDSQHACPEIDKVVREIDSVIDKNVEEIVRKLCPMISEGYRDTFLCICSEFIEPFQEVVAEHVETLRNPNTKARNATEKQLEKQTRELKGKIKEADDEIANLEAKVESLESTTHNREHDVIRLKAELEASRNENRSLNYRISDLEYQLRQAQSGHHRY